MLVSSSFVVLATTAVAGALGGFIGGAPCSERDTAVLDAKGRWRLPKDPVACVDITAMGKGRPIPESPEVLAATTLYADRMRLCKIPGHVLATFRDLRLADFSANRLRKIPKDAFKFHADLDKLLLNDNRLRIPRRAPFLDAPQLRVLSLSNNKIRRLRPRTFAELDGLVWLFLDRNMLTRLDRRTFGPLSKLAYVNLEDNRLKTFSLAVFPNEGVVVALEANLLDDTDVIR